MDSASVVKSAYPTGCDVIVRPNKYEQGRANIIVLNWDHADTVDVDLSSVGLRPGQRYRIQDSQNFYGNPVLSGTYDPTTSRRESAVATLPMKKLETAPVSLINNYSTTPPHTSCEFGAFILLPW